MKRYCSGCGRDVEFTIKSMEELDNLVCPECGAHVDKNSKRPELEVGRERVYHKLGNTAGGIFGFFYIFYVVCAIVGIIGFLVRFDVLVYAMTAVCLVAYVLQWLLGTIVFTSGVIFLPIGAVAGFLIFKNMTGACLGILVVFAIRHIIRDLFFAFIGWLVKIGNQK